MNIKHWILAAFLLIILAAILKESTAEFDAKKKSPPSALLTSIQQTPPVSEATPDIINTNLLHNPFQNTIEPLATNSSWPKNSNPSEWKMMGLMQDAHKTWAILRGPDETIFYISKNHTIDFTVSTLNLEGLTLINNKTHEAMHIPYQDTTVTLAPCVDQTCFSLSAQNIPTNRLLDILGQFESVNLITQPGIESETSIQLINISWQEALDIILKTQGLAQWTINHSAFIGTSNSIIQLEKDATNVEQEQQLADPLTTKIVNLHYLNAEKLLKNLGDNKTLLSARGHLSADPNKNALLIQDLPDRVNTVVQWVTQLDTPSKQINIQAYVISIDNHDESEIGTRLNFTAGNTAPPSVTPADSLSMDLPTPDANNGALGLLAFKLGKNVLLNLELSALESEGLADMIASPHLMTANQQTAMIEAGEEIPYQESSRNGGTTTAFKKAVLKLEVTPQITSPDHILLNIQVNQDQPTQQSVHGMPTIETRQINTQVSVSSGETLVLGGIYEETSSDNNEGVPLLSKIPIIGWAFHHQKKTNNRRQLLIFVTPTIAKS